MRYLGGEEMRRGEKVLTSNCLVRIGVFGKGPAPPKPSVSEKLSFTSSLLSPSGRV
jgi:hypothetical protein